MKTIEDPDVVALFKNRLEHELVETVRLIDESREYRAPVELDQQSVGRLSRMDLNRRRQHRKIAIERAISRIRDHEFGYCITCGEPIAVRRLDIDPTLKPASAAHPDDVGRHDCEETSCRDKRRPCS